MILMYNRLFLIIMIISFSIIQSYAIEENPENITVTVLDEQENIILIWNGTFAELQIQNFAIAKDEVKVDLDEVLKDVEHKSSLKLAIDEFVAGEIGIYWELGGEFPQYYNLVRIKCGFILWDLHGKFLNLTKTNQVNTLSEFVYCSENEIRKEVQESEVIQTVKKQGETGLQWQIILFLIAIPITFIGIWYKKSRKNQSQNL